MRSWGLTAALEGREKGGEVSGTSGERGKSMPTGRRLAESNEKALLLGEHWKVKAGFKKVLPE